MDDVHLSHFDSSPFLLRATSPGGKFSAAIWSANSKVCRASQDEDGMLLCSCGCTQTFGLDMSFTWAGNDCYHDHFKLELKISLPSLYLAFVEFHPQVQTTPYSRILQMPITVGSTKI